MNELQGIIDRADSVSVVITKPKEGGTDYTATLLVKGGSPEVPPLQVTGPIAELDDAISQAFNEGAETYAEAHDSLAEFKKQAAANVEAPNIGRQLYTPDEIGLPKAHALCQRMNLAYGLDWSAQTSDEHGTLNLVCVDSRAARARIYAEAEDHRMEIDRIGDHPEHYYLDFGNTDSTGQVVFGGGALDLPHEHLPALADSSLPDDNKPSCSLAEALEQQELFVNQAVATYGLQILWRIFRHGRIEHRGHHINLAGLAVPINI